MGKRSFSKSWGLRILKCFLLSPPPSPVIPFCLLSSQLSQRTHVEMLATQARGLFTSGRHVDVCMQARIHCRPVKGCMEKALNWMTPDLISKFSFWFVSISKRNWKENVAIYQSIWAFLQVPLTLAWVWVGWWYNAWESRVPMLIITNTSK